VSALAVAGIGLIRLPRLEAFEAPRSLSFHHLHTGENLSVEYFARGEYLNHALLEVNHVLRDWRTGHAYPIDPALLDLLVDLRQAVGSNEPYQVICGYRSPDTNRRLASHSNNVASKSLHMRGKAIDIRLPDVPLARLKAAALKMKRGGVGYYPESNFVHVDTGRVRSW
jgi:uncharacterized protein YcbK (DUF882 family)